MLTKHMQLFVFSLKLLMVFHGQWIEGKITVLAMDTCFLKSQNQTVTYPAGTSRAVVPKYAGREGVTFSSLQRATYKLPIGLRDERKESFSMKFYIKQADRSWFWHNGVAFSRTDNSFSYFGYGLSENGKYRSVITDINTLGSDGIEGHCGISKVDHQFEYDWIQLIGKKVNSAERKKRESPSDDQPNESPWLMIGFDYDGYQNGMGHLNFYINGKVFHCQNITEDNYITLTKSGEIYMRNAKVSCIEYSNEVQDANYFNDFHLKECEKLYQGQPEEKYVQCENGL